MTTPQRGQGEGFGDGASFGEPLRRYTEVREGSGEVVRIADHLVISGLGDLSRCLPCRHRLGQTYLGLEPDGSCGILSLRAPGQRGVRPGAVSATG